MNPIAFDFGNFAIHWYGVFMAAGMLAGMWTASRRGLRERIVPDTILDLGPWVIIGAIIGARLFFVVSYWDEEFAGKSLTRIFAIRTGFVFYGGFAGSALAVILFCRRRKLPLWKIGDVLAPSISLGHALGRIGCLMTGCCHGKVCDVPWAVQFPDGHETHPHWVHPTQIYEAILNFGLYLALAWLFRRKKFDGQIFAIYLMSYAVLRGFVEFFRGDYETYVFGIFTQAHLVSVTIFGVGVMLYTKLPRQIATLAPAEEAKG